MEQGFLIRELPDGGSQFVLDQPALSLLRINHRSTLLFGATEVSIDTAFTLQLRGRTYALDPTQWDALGPLLALYPGTIRWLWTSRDGELTAMFTDGATVSVSPDPVARAWSVGDVTCLPGRPS